MILTRVISSSFLLSEECNNPILKISKGVNNKIDFIRELTTLYYFFLFLL